MSPLLLLLGGVIVAAALTWILPAGQFDRRDDPAADGLHLPEGTRTVELAFTATALSPVKGGDPVTSSYSRQPVE